MKGFTMARFQKISKAEAPLPTRQSGRLAARMRLYEEHVGSLGRGEVGKLTPDTGETARGIALRIGRAGRRVNRPVKAWIDKNVVYFEPVS
jgi:hypothetical protein